MKRRVPGPAVALAMLSIAGLAVVGVALAVNAPGGRIGPKNHIQPTGRKLEPVGKMTRLGNFPTGGALTVDGRFLWTLSTGRGRNDIRIVRVSPRGGKIVQLIRMPGLSGGIVMSRDGKRAYVSGLKDSEHADEQVPASVPGQEGDVVHVFKLNRRSGHAARAGVISVPPPSSAPVIQTFPPAASQKESWPRDLAVSRDGKTLLVALNLADAAAIVNTATHAVRYVDVGNYPYGAGITRNGKFGLVTSETEGAVYVIALSSGNVVKQIQVGPRLSHPESIAMDPKRDRAYVAVTSQDVIAAVDTKRMRVIRTVSVARPQGNGTTPSYLSVTGDGCDLLSADSGEDAVAIIALSRAGKCAAQRGRRARGVKPFGLVGRVPVASYPTAVAAPPNRRKLVWISARGLGIGPNPHGPNPNSPNDSDDHINSFQFMPSIVRGSSGILAYPSDARIRALTPRASRQIVPTNHRKPPAGTPVRGNGPIKHVFYIVKEN